MPSLFVITNSMKLPEHILLLGFVDNPEKSRKYWNYYKNSKNHQLTLIIFSAAKGFPFLSKKYILLIQNVIFRNNKVKPLNLKAKNFFSLDIQDGLFFVYLGLIVTTAAH